MRGASDRGDGQGGATGEGGRGGCYSPADRIDAVCVCCDREGGKRGRGRVLAWSKGGIKRKRDMDERGGKYGRTGNGRVGETVGRLWVAISSPHCHQLDR